MALTNIKIITNSGQEIDYISPESLNIKLNRVVDDLINPDNRFGEYSYTFSLPKTKNNVSIFEYAGVPNIYNNFKANPIQCKIYDDDKIIIDGQIELRTIEEDRYNVVMYNKFVQLIDSIKDKSLQDIKSLPHLIGFDYENTIREHINANYKNSDEAYWQFPLVFYNTFFTPTNTFTGKTDQNGNTFRRDNDRECYYNLINDSGLEKNEFYFHQFPLAWYLKPVIEGILADAGWTLGGSFFEGKDIKKIIIPYTGDSDVYDTALYCADIITPPVIVIPPEIPTGDVYYNVSTLKNANQMGYVNGYGSYKAGSIIQLTANAYPDYEFVEWQYCGSTDVISSKSIINVEVNQDLCFEAIFRAIVFVPQTPTPTPTPTQTPTGTIIPNTPTPTPTITATPTGTPTTTPTGTPQPTPTGTPTQTPAIGLQTVIDCTSFSEMTSYLGGDCTVLSTWNTYFNLPTNGNPYTSINIDTPNKRIQLIGGSNISIGFNGFHNNPALYEFYDSGCITNLSHACFENNPYCIGYRLDGVTSIDGSWNFYANTSCQSIILQNMITTGDIRTFSNCTALNVLDIRSCTKLGASTGNNDVFTGISGNVINLYVNNTLMTCNGGNPDADIQWLQSNNNVLLNQEITPTPTQTKTPTPTPTPTPTQTGTPTPTPTPTPITVNGFNGAVLDILTLTDNSLIVLGEFTHYNNTQINNRTSGYNVVKLTADGGIDNSFTFDESLGIMTSNSFKRIGLDSNERLYVFGTFSGSDKVYVLNKNTGTKDNSYNFNYSTNFWVFDFSFDSSDRLFILGEFEGNDYSLRRFNTDGSIDYNYQFNITSYFSGINGFISFGSRMYYDKIQSKPFIIVYNYGNYQGTPYYNGVLYRLSSSNTPVVQASVSVITKNNGSVPEFSEVSKPNNLLLIGNFDKIAQAIDRVNIMSLVDNTYNLDLDPSFYVGTGFSGGVNNSIVMSSDVESNGSILCCGDFTHYNGTYSDGLVRLNSNGTISNTLSIGIGFSVGNNNGHPNVVAHQLNGKIIIGGSFTTFNGSNVSNIIRLNSDGSIDSTFNN